jgi:DNA integrity scanning protein DisA with diadenylate cyclase activity|tara:strand:- start:712 stop:1305 length:594 start_codon:yes stop_codon:yes gene_type:complete
MKEDTTDDNTSEVQRASTTFADFSFQFSAAREFQKVEKKVFSLLCSISDQSFEGNKRHGLLVVIGGFDMSKDYIVYGMRQIGVNPVEKYLNIAISSFSKDIKSLFSKEYDGAIIVNRNGHIIGAKIYLTVDNPSLEVPGGCGTRHITAASFSKRDDVISVLTLSEETNIVRIWKDGSFVEQYSPEDEDNSDNKESGE